MQSMDDQDKMMPLIGLLASHGVNLNDRAQNLPDGTGRLATPLEAAITKYNIKYAVALIKVGADVNPVSPDGITPLFIAARKQNAKLIEMLLAAGANVNAVNALGQTPLDWSHYGQDTRIADLLTIHGAHKGAGGDIPNI